MAVQGRTWHSCKGEEKAELRVRFDAIKASARPSEHLRIEAELDAWGVGLRR
jgi:hypothetical protein